jgi:hypothetical protein
MDWLFSDQKKQDNCDHSHAEDKGKKMVCPDCGKTWDKEDDFWGSFAPSGW